MLTEVNLKEHLIKAYFIDGERKILKYYIHQTISKQLTLYL